MPYRASPHPHPVPPASSSATALEGKPRNHPGDNKCPPAPLPLPAPPREALFRLGNAFTCVARASGPQQGIKGGDRSAGWPGAGSGQREEGAAGGMLHAPPGTAQGGVKGQQRAGSKRQRSQSRLIYFPPLQLFIHKLNRKRSEAGRLLRGGVCGRKEGTGTPPRDGCLTLLLPQPQS